jgi:hypothetical protein
VYIFYGVKKEYRIDYTVIYILNILLTIRVDYSDYGVGKLGMSFALKSPVALNSDDLLGGMTAWRICKGSILRD